MLFLFGDSHSRGFGLDRTLDKQYERESSLGTWVIVPTGGATAHGLLNESSSTGAGQKIRETLDQSTAIGKIVVLMFGEVDCTNHFAQQDDPISYIIATADRLHLFVQKLVARPDVSHVFVCSSIPHVAAFRFDKADSIKIDQTTTLWSIFAESDIDILTPLKQGGQFLPNHLCHTPDGLDERHLSKEGYELIWDQIIAQVNKKLQFLPS